MRKAAEKPAAKPGRPRKQVPKRHIPRQWSCTCRWGHRNMTAPPLWNRPGPTTAPPTRPVSIPAGSISNRRNRPPIMSSTGWRGKLTLHPCRRSKAKVLQGGPQPFPLPGEQTKKARRETFPCVLLCFPGRSAGFGGLRSILARSGIRRAKIQRVVVQLQNQGGNFLPVRLHRHRAAAIPSLSSTDT